MPIADEIRTALEAEFAPERLEIRDDSERHRGHSGWREGGETHFHILMRAQALGPMSRLKRHRAVHEALGADLVGRIHALSMDLAE